MDETILLSVSDHSDLFHHTFTEWHGGADALAHRPRREGSSWRKLQGQAAAVKVYFEVGVSDGSDGKVKHRVSAWAARAGCISLAGFGRTTY